MQVLKVIKVSDTSSMAVVSQQLEKFEQHPISQVNWPEYAYDLKVSFSIGYSEDCLYLKYHVNENSIIAVTDKDNGPVWKDSCVEFFVAPANDDYYYNFEFNCIGYCLLGYGNSRHNRQMAPAEVFPKIVRIPSLEQKHFGEKKGDVSWSLFVAIPASCLFSTKGVKFEHGKKMKANFYKCGDGLSNPHYLTWNKIKTEKPDYHRPEFFGEIVFQ